MNREVLGSGDCGMCLRVMLASLALLLGCSDFECPDGRPRVDGTCTPAEIEPSDLEPRTKRIPMACTNNLAPQAEGAAGFTRIEWELTVDPGRIPGGERFGADFKAFAGFNEFILNGAQELIDGGLSRLNVEQLRATVLVRRGTDDTDPVPLELGPSSLPWTCRYDELGNVDADPSGRAFPSCSPANNNPDGSNEDCTGLDGARDSNNPCGQFKDIPISDDCSDGGFCDSLGQQWPTWQPALAHCKGNGFCVKGPLEVELAGEDDSFFAADFGHVLFGFDDVDTGAELDQTNGPNDGTWELPDAVYDAELPPNGLRATSGETGEIEIALDCTMAISSWGVFARETPEERSKPAPDHVLISFPIQ